MDDVANAFRIAAQYRQEFGRDVVIDLVGYRKMGHNELDQPSYTQPLMYAIVKNMNPVRNVYRQHLLDLGIPEATLKEVDDKA
jgi:2-oxoglutarate dehydrogenase complex dehydrogenase (E1) component-like enzyme